MWLSTFTTKHGDICIRFGTRAVNLQACAAAHGLAKAIKNHPKIASGVGIMLPILIQLYFASREYNGDSPPRSLEK